MKNRSLFLAPVFFLSISPVILAATLEVGPGKSFSRIEDAYQKANSGDTILVYPQPTPYYKVAIRVLKSNITFRAASPDIKISGEGFDYSNVYPVPRAFFQFDKGADNGRVEGFELYGAHNADYNGSGVMINEANNITIKRCKIHDNDNGVMSWGVSSTMTGSNQRIEYCRIYRNGAMSGPGSHNFYLQGESAVIRFCEIFKSIGGHNVKSRTHYTLVEHNYIHDADSRELDFVDSESTQRARSDVVLVSNIIVKELEGTGNHQVIYFGKDGGHDRIGTLYMIHNTIITNFQGAFLALSTPKARASLIGNLVCDNSGSGGQEIASIQGGANGQDISGEFNVFGRRFEGPGNTRLSTNDNVFGWNSKGAFLAPETHDYRPAHPFPYSLPAKLIMLPDLPPPLKYDRDGPFAWQYKYPRERQKRPQEERLTVGAYGYSDKI